MTRRLRIAIGSAIILAGLLAIVVIVFFGVTRTSVGQERVRRMVATMLEGKVKGKVYIGRMSGGLVSGGRDGLVGNSGEQKTGVFSWGPNTLPHTPRGPLARRPLVSHPAGR